MMTPEKQIEAIRRGAEEVISEEELFKKLEKSYKDKKPLRIKAGLQDLHFHDLRHTFATRLIQGGADIYAVKRMLGHRSIKTTERYAHHSPESLRASVRHLDEVYCGDNLGSVSRFSHVLADDMGGLLAKGREKTVKSIRYPIGSV